LKKKDIDQKLRRLFTPGNVEPPRHNYTHMHTHPHTHTLTHTHAHTHTHTHSLDH